MSTTTSAVDEKKKTYARAFTTVFGKGLYDEKILEKFRPVTIVMIMSFDKPMDVEKVRALVLERCVKRWDRFCSRMVLQGSRVVFQELSPEDLNMDYHVTVEKSQGWDEADWNKFLIKIYSDVKDVSQPLWRWHVCNDLKSGQSRVVLNIDHSVCDGISLSYCFNEMLDPDESAPPTVVSNPVSRPKPAIKLPKPGLLDRAWWTITGIAEGFLSPVLPGDPMSSMKVKDIQVPSKEKRFSNSKTISLSKVKAIKDKLGVTVNDVLGGVLNMTIQRYLRETEPEKMTAGRSLRINFPINMRAPTRSMIPEIHNEISTGTVKVGLNHTSTVEAIMEHYWLMQEVKNSPAALVQLRLLDLLSRILPYEMLVQLAFILFGKYTMMMSNVPGPLKARPFGGVMCTDLHFFLFVPIGIYCGMISYDGRMSFTVSCDTQTETSPEQVTQIWVQEFEKLHDQVMAPDFKATWKPKRSSMLTQAVIGAGCVGVVAFIFFRKR
mmetsp:Transcript_39377/g.92848  ORF Transcript_39377/g.92848 Transcript_39377/m.92848 type:complete len:493 (-) Transcript_39377:188-1666(-)